MEILNVYEKLIFFSEWLKKYLEKLNEYLVGS